MTHYDNRPLVYPQFAGRLGNNMFQIAACIGYAKKYGVRWGIQKGYVEKGFNVFQVDKCFPNLPACTDQYRTWHEHKDEYCHIHNTHKDICHFNYHEIPFHPNGVKLSGFYQSWRYFDNAEEDVKQAFKLTQYPELSDCVSIHIRRGDYVQECGSFPPVTEEYVFKAWHKIQELTNKEYFTPMFFSDDIEWCKKTFDHSFPDAEYSDGKSEWEDLCMMSSCGHNIISNSTFSWWAAYLNNNPNKIIVSPSHKRGNWFGLNSGVKTDCVDLIPASWHQIEFR